MARYCPDCGYVIIPKEFIDHNDSCRCGEYLDYSTSDSSCIEKTLLPKVTLRWRYNRDYDEWAAYYSPWKFQIVAGDLWVYCENQFYCFSNDPAEHMKIIRSYL